MAIQEDIGDDLHLMLQVVEDKQGIGDHEERHHEAEVLRKKFWDPLERPDHVITEIAYRTPKKSRKGVVEDGFERSEKIFEGSERVLSLAPF